MKWLICGFLIFAALIGVALSKNAVRAAGNKLALVDAAAPGVGEELQGEWLLSSAEVQGKSLPVQGGKGGSIVFAKDGKLILKDPGKPDTVGKYKVDAGASPMQLDVTLAKNGEGKPFQGIYELDGDNLKMCFFAEGAKGKRPSEFKGDKLVIMHFKRQK